MKAPLRIAKTLITTRTQPPAHTGAYFVRTLKHLIKYPLYLHTLTHSHSSPRVQWQCCWSTVQMLMPGTRTGRHRSTSQLATRRYAVPRLWFRCSVTSTCLTVRDALLCITLPSVDMSRLVSFRCTQRYLHRCQHPVNLLLCDRWSSCYCPEEPTSMHLTRRTGEPSTGEPTWVCY